MKEADKSRDQLRLSKSTCGNKSFSLFHNSQWLNEKLPSKVFGKSMGPGIVASNRTMSQTIGFNWAICAMSTIVIIPSDLLVIE